MSALPWAACRRRWCELRAAYLFLRDSEHAIQGYQDKQTQDLPEDPLHMAMAT